MRAPSAAQLIGMWERGARQPWVDRALTLVSACHPELTDSGLAALTVGERDADLLALREGLFGRALKSFAECPNCQARLEFSVDANELRESFANAANADPAELLLDDIRIQFRRLSTADLTAAARCADVNAARRVLLERSSSRRGATASRWPGRFTGGLRRSAVVPVGGARRRRRHRARSALRCRGHAWQLTLDIVRFLWAEVNALAKAYLNEVHMLAWAYGWREADILAMSSARRQFYLERVG